MDTRVINKNPFLRILIPYCLGVILSVKIEVFNVKHFVLLIVATVMVFLLLFWNKYYKPYSYTYSVFVFFLFLFCGLINASIKVPQLQEKEFSDTLYQAKITSRLKEKGKTFQGVAILCNSKTKTKLWISFEKDSSCALLQPGKQYVFWGKINKISNRGNPGEFDFKFYAKNKEICYQVYHESGSWELIKKREFFSLSRLSVKVQQYLCSVMEEQNIKAEHKGFLKAFLLGYKDDLPEKRKEEFAKAGASHILAISGLHVGILYLMFLSILNVIPLLRKLQITKVLILMILLWGFAFITGLTNSVVRAVMMFSFLQAGKLLNRPVNPFNSLFASAFILLVINPFNLYNVGFQLSYSAVLSIFAFFHSINTFLHFRLAFLNKLWSLFSLTLSAQIGTFPLVIYYFKTFPVYFLITNIWVFIFVTIILYAGIISLFMGLFSIHFPVFDFFLNFLMETFNTGISFIADLPYSVWETSLLSNSAFILLLAGVMLMIGASLFKSKRLILISLLIINVFIGVQIKEELSIKNQKGLVVFNTGKNTVTSYIRGKKHEVFISFKEKDLGKTEKRILEEASLFYGCEKAVIHEIYKENCIPVVCFEDKKIAVVKSSVSLCYSECPHEKVDYLILESNLRGRYEEFFFSLQPEQLILSGYFRNKDLTELERLCKKFSVKMHEIKKEGAFIKNLH